MRVAVTNMCGTEVVDVARHEYVWPDDVESAMCSIGIDSTTCVITDLKMLKRAYARFKDIRVFDVIDLRKSH